MINLWICLNQMDKKKIESLLGLAARARKLATGASAVEAGLRKKNVYLILLATDSGVAIERKVRSLVTEFKSKCPVIKLISKSDLGMIFNRTDIAVVGVQDKNFAAGIIEYFNID